MVERRNPPSMEIERLLEAGEDGGNFMGYYARGHHPATAFAAACNEDSGIDSQTDSCFAWAKDVQHVWWRTVPIAGEPGNSKFIEAAPESHGAWKATVIDFAALRLEKEERWRQAGHKDGLRRGRYDTICWAIEWLEANGHADAAKALLPVWNKKRDAEQRTEDEAERQERQKRRERERADYDGLIDGLMEI